MTSRCDWLFNTSIQMYRFYQFLINFLSMFQIMYFDVRINLKWINGRCNLIEMVHGTKFYSKCSCIKCRFAHSLMNKSAFSTRPFGIDFSSFGTGLSTYSSFHNSLVHSPPSTDQCKYPLFPNV